MVAFKQAQHQCFGSLRSRLGLFAGDRRGLFSGEDTVLGELTDLIGLTIERVLVGHSQHLIVVQRLVQVR
jgi:hypothetical protein